MIEPSVVSALEIRKPFRIGVWTFARLIQELRKEIFICQHAHLRVASSAKQPEVFRFVTTVPHKMV